MNIGFDAKRAFLNYTGLGNYSRALIESLADNYPSENYVLYTPKFARNPRTAALFSDKFSIVTPSFPFFKSLWRSRFITPKLKADKIDIYHGLSNELPAGLRKAGIQSVVTIHDLIFLRYPQYYKAADRKIYEAKFRYACKYSDKIIAVSEQTKRDIISFFKTDADKIEVIYQGCDASFSKPFTKDNLQQIKEKYSLPEKFILNVGTVEERKNVSLAVKALHKIKEEISLVIVGRHTDYAEKVKEYIAQNKLVHRVLFLDSIAFHDLPGIYRLAQLFVNPSRFEGFGIPILEALNCGVPVVAATGSCLEEAGGAGSQYVHPDDDIALSNTINAILSDDILKQQMIANGYKHAATITNETMATQTMNLYQRLHK